MTPEPAAPLPPAPKPDAGEPELSIVIPAYNEEKRIGPTLRAVGDYLARRGRRAEILVVDDGSGDGTVRRVEQLASEIPGLRLIRNDRNRGKGFSIRHGFAQCRAELVLLTDADLSAPIEELDRLLPAVREGGNAIAVGSRAVDPARVEIRQGWLRQTMGKGFNRIVRLLTGLAIRDTQCGFKLLRREPLIPVFRMARVDRFSYDVEILYLAHRRGLGIAEIPVRWRNSPQSKVRILADSLQMFWDVVRIALRDRAGAYREKP